MTPYSDSSSSFDMVDDVAGCETPMPRPDRASATTMMTVRRGLRVAKRSMETNRDPVPTSVAVRSPVRTVMYPAMGALIANSSGRATEMKPTCDTLYP